MDFPHAKQIFKKYLNEFDRCDDKIKLKVTHTYQVVAAAQYIAKGLELSEEDTLLASHIALLHDIGRFEQLKRCNSFDDAIVPHAELSLDILFDRHMIEQFIPEREYDDTIYTAIKNHGLYLMESGLTGSALLHTQIIRDADKLDNFRVKEVSDMKTLLDISAEELGAEAISDHILGEFLQYHPIKNSERITHMDMWVSYLGYLFDLNFPVSLAYSKDHDYVNKLVDRIAYSNPDTYKKMEQIRKTALDYIALHG